MTVGKTSPVPAQPELLSQAPSSPGTLLPQSVSNDRAVHTIIPTLDGWRAIAIMLVMLAHSSDELADAFRYFGLQAHLDFTKHLGLLGVEVFFALSGFLITSRLIEEEFSAGAVSLWQFYARRFFRILPAAFVFVATIGALGWLHVVPLTLARWVSALVFAANYSLAEPSYYLTHFWSLAVEEHFYFIWPAIFILLKSFRHRILLSMTLMIVVAVWRYASMKFGLIGPSYAWFFSRTDIFADALLGGVVFALMDSQGLLTSLKAALRSQWIWFALLLAVLLANLLSPGHWLRTNVEMTFQAWAIPILILGTVTYPTRLVSTVLESSSMVWIGKRSYSLYLWQQLFLVYTGLGVSQLSVVQQVPLSFGAALLTALLSYKLVEQPMIQVGRSCIRRRLGTSAPMR